MATRTAEQTAVKLQPLVKIREMDHIVLRVRDVDKSLHFYTEVLGLHPERIEQFKAGEVRFPSVRLNDDTIIDLFPSSDMEPIGRDAPRNQDHFCMVIEPTDMDELKSQFQAMGVDIQAGPGPRWGAHGNGTSLYVYDPDNNVVELRYY
ncbi:MAG TPA: VOC family protein [Candidatus Tectomicrobia bacterium]|jgi:catechol 2,3-dioxygenase-like lactoylglutathione lyase family enzyme